MAATTKAVTRVSGGYRPIEHTADLAFEAWGDDEAAMLVEAARAVVGVLTGGAAIVASDERAITLAALDAEDRLVRWLNEVMWLAMGEGFLVADARLELAEGALHGRVCGEADAGARLVTEIKAATYHDLAIAHAPGRVSARFVLDV